MMCMGRMSFSLMFRLNTYSDSCKLLTVASFQLRKKKPAICYDCTKWIANNGF